MSKILSGACVGLGLRPKHYQDLLKHQPEIDFLEVLSEDYMQAGGEAIALLDQISQCYPLVLHGVGLSIGSCDPLNEIYLQQLKQLIDRYQPKLVSDHCCWTGVNGYCTHDLLPLAFTQEALDHVIKRIIMVQQYLGQQILLENISSYIQFSADEMSEWVFLANLAEAADCFILLDINNIYVNSINHGFDPLDYLHAMPKHRVKQFHLAGYKSCQTHLLDTHDHQVSQPVWALYQQAIAHFGPVPTIIERDGHIPSLSAMLDEVNQAKQAMIEFQPSQELV